VVAGETSLGARELLERLLAVEREYGRSRPSPKAPRTLDLDLVLLGDTVVDEPGLQVPHPRFRERFFVLGPLVEIAPDLRDPVIGTADRGTAGRCCATPRADPRSYSTPGRVCHPAGQ
jgi:2-amino-4-hydroxy-6-hydroxymethyldihydropteridine diphosphokinase